MSISALYDFIQSHIGIIIIMVFAGIPLVIGSAASMKSVSTVSDFFLCSRSLKTIPAFFTLYATWWSSFAFLGSTSTFYSQGPVYWVALGWNVLFGLIFYYIGIHLWRLGKIENHRTPINYFRSKYQSEALNNIVIITMILFSLPYIAAQMIGGGILIEMATLGLIPWRISALIFLVIMIVYLWSGGLRAVVWADILYAVFIFVGMLMIGILFINLTGGVSHTFRMIALERPDLLKLPASISGLTGYGFWVSMLIIMPLGEIMMPQIWTRIYSIKEAKTFYVMPVLLSVATIAYVGTMLAGNSAILLEPVHSGPSDYIIPTLLLKYVSKPLMAFIMCCAASACLSTANSQLLAVSQLITLDIYKPYFKKKATEKHLVFSSKVVILILAALSYLFLYYAPTQSIIDTAFLSFSVMMQLSVPVIGSLLFKNGTAEGAISGLICGIGITLIFSLWQPYTYLLSPSLFGLIANIIFFISISYFIKERRLVATQKIINKDKRIRFLWVCILICFFMIASPFILIVNNSDVTFMGLPMIYIFVFIIWIALCLFLYKGYKLAWGEGAGGN